MKQNHHNNQPNDKPGNQPKQSFYVTTSIAYANAKPHVGYAMELFQADTLARYYRQAGQDTYFVTGTDEHGQKLKEAAAKQNMPTQEYVDTLSQDFMSLAKLLDLTNDKFVRTTDAGHKLAAQKLWLACENDIYKGQYKGLYCVGHETFIKESELEGGICPDHKTKPQELELESYFFALSKYAKKLENIIESGELKIVPEKRRNEMLGFLRSGLEDISISRPKSQLEWGVEVPNDPDHVMYVWFDALSNYISAIGYESDSQKFERFWPANVHVVGKDIARFHCLVWPAMLLSAGLETPKAVFVHSFITSDGQKMSKSLGNVIDPVDYANSYGVDALRYYLLRFIPSYNDGDFSLDRFEEVYNTDLANNLGNLVSRVAAMLVKYNDGKYDIVSPKTEIDISGLVAEFRFDKCLEQIFARLDSLNVAIDNAKPWEIAKTNPAKAVEFLSAMAGELTQVASALAPFLPETSQKILAVFDNGKIAPSPQVLFPRID